MRKRLLALFIAVITVTLLLLPSAALARDELKNTDPNKYYIELDLDRQIITVFTRDDAGQYTRIVRRMVCTTGRTEVDPLDPEDVATPTPSGVWHIGARERFGKFAAFSNEYARYWTQLVDGVYFHSIMFEKREVDAIKKSPFGRLGSKGSHGCIRLYVEDAKWMYYHACPGTKVNVTGDAENPKGITKACKTSMSFDEYKEFQQNIYDEPELENFKAWVAVDDMPLRTGNGNNDRVIKRLEAGVELEVLQDGDPWVKVRFGEKEGYIKRVYVTYEQGVMQSVEDGHSVKHTTYLFEAEDRSSTRLCKIPHDTSLNVISYNEETGFYKVTYWGETGYVVDRDVDKDWAMISGTEGGEA